VLLAVLMGVEAPEAGVIEPPVVGARILVKHAIGEAWLQHELTVYPPIGLHEAQIDDTQARNRFRVSAKLSWVRKKRHI
jgi:hypothetical protein